MKPVHIQISPARQWVGLTVDQLEPGIIYEIEAGPKTGPYRASNIVLLCGHATPAATLNIYTSDGGRNLAKIQLGGSIHGKVAKRVGQMRFSRRPPTEAELADARATLAEYRSFQRAQARLKEVTR